MTTDARTPTTTSAAGTQDPPFIHDSPNDSFDTRTQETTTVTDNASQGSVDLSGLKARTSPDTQESLVDDSRNTVFDIQDLAVYYGDFRAVRDVNLSIREQEITAFIGPSGCGKTTVLRSINRMNDFIETARVEGKVLYHGVDLYDDAVNATEVRRRIGMVFQKPNPFPKSIFENVAYGPKLLGTKKGDLPELVERSLRGAALWDEVKDRLDASGLSLSGGQQQRLCIARAIAVQPEVILMDEPCSALDPIATARIEDLMQEMKADYTIIIVTHNMQQAARVSDRTAFFTTEVNTESDRRTGVMVEFDDTQKMFSNPSDERTEAYVTGRFG